MAFNPARSCGDDQRSSASHRRTPRREGTVSAMALAAQGGRAGNLRDSGACTCLQGLGPHLGCPSTAQLRSAPLPRGDAARGAHHPQEQSEELPDALELCLTVGGRAASR